MIKGQAPSRIGREKITQSRGERKRREMGERGRLLFPSSKATQGTTLGTSNAVFRQCIRSKHWPGRQRAIYVKSRGGGNPLETAQWRKRPFQVAGSPSPPSCPAPRAPHLLAVLPLVRQVLLDKQRVFDRLLHVVIGLVHRVQRAARGARARAARARRRRRRQRVALVPAGQAGGREGGRSMNVAEGGRIGVTCMLKRRE